MRIHGGDLNGHIAGLVQRKVLEVRARIKAEGPPDDRCRAFGRRDADRICQAAAIIIAVHIRAKRSQININRRTVFDRSRNTRRQTRRIIRARHGNRDCRLIRVAIRISDFIGESHVARFALGQIFKFPIGIKRKAANNRRCRKRMRRCAFVKDQDTCRWPRHQDDRLCQIRHIIVQQNRREANRCGVLGHTCDIVSGRDRFVGWIKFDPVYQDPQVFEFAGRQIKGRELEAG
ncbi:hypothetical protein PEV8663_03203 [Pelagimonas varians]|uniref:Uncharacterized protein n=1 Tax=Pelagimonas varians TaxID=696760 RepID=A0A238KVD1_9RHOB|nr:hypothetical protein PEV8663_03203 [Pelagimonas varians]